MDIDEQWLRSFPHMDGGVPDAAMAQTLAALRAGFGSREAVMRAGADGVELAGVHPFIAVRMFMTDADELVAAVRRSLAAKDAGPLREALARIEDSASRVRAVNAMAERTTTPLGMAAASASDGDDASLELVRVLLEAGGDPGSAGDATAHARPPVLYPLTTGSAACMRMLLEADRGGSGKEFLRQWTADWPQREWRGVSGGVRTVLAERGLLPSAAAIDQRQAELREHGGEQVR